VKSKKKVAASVETAAAKPVTPNLVVPTQRSPSPLEEISDLLDHFPSKHVWSWLIGSSLPSPPSPQGQPTRELS